MVPPSTGSGRAWFSVSSRWTASCGLSRRSGKFLSRTRHVFAVTVFMAYMLWLVFSTALYFSERSHFDEEMTETYGSVYRSLWAEIINLHGEYPWCDYTAEG